MIVPVAPYLEPAPTDFSVVAGFDFTYQFASVYPGDPTDFTWLVESEELEEDSQYTFNRVPRTIIIKASDSSFESLAGTTIIVTSTLSNTLT